MIFCFSGTGNSLYIARRIAKEINEEIIDLNVKIKNNDNSGIKTGENLIIVVPTYAWRIPRIVSKWILETEFIGAKRLWFVMDCGGEIGNASKYNRKISEKKNLCYMGTAQIVMPENYIAMFKAPTPAVARKIIEKAEPLIDNVIKHIKAEEAFSKPRNNLYDRFMSGPINPLFYHFFVKPSAFKVKTTCIGCGKCVNKCPLNNIKLDSGKPIWGKNCTHCMACICYCPVEAIEYGKKSKGKQRYYFEKL